jgi:glycosyltransferase involved in cell wall biosynthesis
VKNQAMMLRALSGVLARYPQARLRIIGDGPERSGLEALAGELRISGSVEFLGFRKDVGALLAESDVFLMSSHYEGISIAVLEAMCAGLPVLATRVGGIPEMVEDGRTGVLVPDGDVEAMAQAMGKLLDSSHDRQRLGAAGKEFLQREFSIDMTAERYFRLYQGLQ